MEQISRSAFIILIISVIFEQRPFGDGVANIRVSFIHELRFCELLEGIINAIYNEKFLYIFLPDNPFIASKIAP